MEPTDLLTPWSWLIVAVLLAGAEILAPGIFMIWLAAAALSTGILVAVLNLTWEAQLVLFAALAIVSVISGRAFVRRNPTLSADPNLNRRGDSLVGQVVTVTHEIQDGEGKVQVGDSPWIACGEDTPVGTRVRITKVEGARLLVERA